MKKVKVSVKKGSSNSKSSNAVITVKKGGKTLTYNALVFSNPNGNSSHSK